MLILVANPPEKLVLWALVLLISVELQCITLVKATPLLTTAVVFIIVLVELTIHPN